MRDALAIVRPKTFIGWHRKGFQLFWHWKCDSVGPRIPLKLADLALDRGTATTLAGFPAPVGPKAAPMPSNHGSGLTTVFAFRIAGKQRYGQTRSADLCSAVAPATGLTAPKRSPADAKPGSQPRGAPVISIWIVRRAVAWPGTRTSRLALAQLSHSVIRTRFSVATALRSDRRRLSEFKFRLLSSR